MLELTQVMKMKKRKNFIIGKIAVIAMLLVVVVTSSYLFKLYSDKQIESQTNLQKIRLEKEKTENQHLKIDKEKLSSIDNVMIVAHPDDETFWAGSYLEKEDFLVICLTNGDNEVRKNEFQTAMKATNDYGIILNYPDNPNHVISNWAKEKKSIEKDISYILHYKKWKKIVTHNPDGEYGHIHHKMTSSIVMKECVKDNMSDYLFYFEKYYTKEYINNHTLAIELSSKESNNKNVRMRDIYRSQSYSYKKFKHMIPYEKLIPYSQWEIAE